MFTWTVDVESDFGGRTDGTNGVEVGLPIIIEVFKQHSVRGLFFISTELTSYYPSLIESIRKEGHEVGSHGHFHIKFEDKWRSEEDRRVSLQYVGEEARYRAPWFNYKTEDFYSQKEGHVSVLKRAWFGGMLPNDPIFYIHPFDIVGGKGAPNLYTRILYSRPQHVLDTFRRLVRLYPYSPKG